jgi:hypothetical protein
MAPAPTPIEGASIFDTGTVQLPYILVMKKSAKK